jgi:cell wall-associated NlpC family hydrolase
MGAPYRFGGTTTSGVDCSALVRAVYAGAFGLRLTRSTKTQVREGHAVAKSELRSGDLVFFRTGPNQRHVGIYLDGGRLLHASSSQDRVLVDDLGREHFQRTYWTARRLLDVGPGAPAPYAETSPRPAPPPRPMAPVSAGPARPGW